MGIDGDRGVEYASAGPDVSSQDVNSERSYQELLALSRVSAAVSGLNDLDAILNVGLDAVLELMGGTIGGIALIDEQTNTLSYRVYRCRSYRSLRPRIHPTRPSPKLPSRMAPGDGTTALS